VQRDNRTPRQSDIARAAGVSQATVSLILTGRAAENSIPQATRDRVLAAIEKLGYVPNIAAQSLRGGRNGLIGVHTFESVFPVTSEDYYHEFLVGIEEQAVDMGLDLVLFASTQGTDGRRRIYGSGTNRLRLADGAVMLGIERNEEDLERLAAERYPFVFIGRRDGVSAHMPYVTADYPAAVAVVVDRLHEAGHRQIGYLAHVTRASPQEERLAAFTEHARRRGVATPPPVFLPPAELTRAHLDEIIASATALVIENHESATSLASVARAAGIEIPRDLSVVVLDSVPRDSMAYGWSQIHIPRRELGRRAVFLLMELLDERIPSDYHELLQIDEPAGASIGSPPSFRRTAPAD
jgi:DNA-binding LacI/PurR family transcriptional regulator